MRTRLTITNLQVTAIALATYILSLSSAEAQTPTVPEHWWDIAKGVLAVPAALIALFVAYAAYRKTKLEGDKVELDIREKQAALAKSGITETPEARQIADQIFAPLIDNNRVNYFVLRFALFFLILSFWGIFEDVFGFAVTGAIITLQQLLHYNLAGSSMVAAVVATYIPKIGHILLILVIGVPLYRDIARHIGFRFFSPRTGAASASRDTAM